MHDLLMKMFLIDTEDVLSIKRPRVNTGSPPQINLQVLKVADRFTYRARLVSELRRLNNESRRWCRLKQMQEINTVLDDVSDGYHQGRVGNLEVIGIQR